jgi:U3 small nucleolar RNA-associated protein 12
LSTDDSLLATGSLDKDIKLWDLQFGNTIKTIFAHQEGITIVKFIEETHYLFSGAKDGHVKFWDMDTWELIMDF